MCGIAGILRFTDAPASPDRHRRILTHMRHRGPDGQGRYTQGRCDLLHTRLAICDIPAGGQPMVLLPRGKAGELAVVFNGEIYNHRRLRTELESLGHVFFSDHCDTEVLLHGYRQWGTDLPGRLEGMFAFAIWDVATQTLFLARDRAGKKPLFYRWVQASFNQHEFHFASLLGTIALFDPPGGDHLLSPTALATYLRLGYFTRETLLPGVLELPPAHFALLSPPATLSIKRYWSPPPVSNRAAGRGPVQTAHELIGQAVRARLEADVPLGCFLSGGIDSSLVAALAQRALQLQNRDPLLTFNVAMPDADYDESPKARLVAQHLGTRHQTLKVDGGQAVMADLRHLLATSGMPTADSSILPTYWLSRATRQHVQVALSGDGGDELFGGYDRYRGLRLLQRHRWWLSRIPPGLVRPQVLQPRSMRNRLARLMQAARSAEAPAQYLQMIEIFNPHHIAMVAPDLSADLGVKPDWPTVADPVQSAMSWDFANYLPFDLLRKVDQASMAVALEVRCPLLDAAVCDYVAQLPASVLMPAGRAKGLLRTIAAPYLPKDILQQKKQGFAIPIGRWFRTHLRDSLGEVLLDSSLTRLGFSQAGIETLFRDHVDGRADHTHRLFGLLSLALWNQWLSDIK